MQAVTAASAEPAPNIPPLPRGMSQRLSEADREWQNLRRTIFEYQDNRNALTGASLYLGLARFLRILCDDPTASERAIANIEERLRAEFPPQTGRLL